MGRFRSSPVRFLACSIRFRMSDSLTTVSSFSDVSLTRDETLSLALKTVVPFRVIRMAVLGKTVYEFWTIKGDGKTSMTAALSDPTVPRQTAYLVAFDGKDTFQMGYARNGEEAQCVMDVPLARLLDAVNDLREAGF